MCRYDVQLLNPTVYFDTFNHLIQFNYSGIPGSGKTETAKQWIYAEIIEKSLPIECHKIQCARSGDDDIKSSLKSFLNTIDQTVVEKDNPRDLVQEVIVKLLDMRDDNRCWMLMFDDLRDSSHCDEILSVISGFAGKMQNKIWIIITTREAPHQHDDLFKLLPVPPKLSPEDAITFLQMKTNREYNGEKISEIESEIRLLPLKLKLFAGILKGDHVRF